MSSLNLPTLYFLPIVLILMSYPLSILAKHPTNHESCCCPKKDKDCSPTCEDPCALDPKEILIDYCEDIPSNDDSLMILVNTEWPIKDWSWYIRGIQIMYFGSTKTSKVFRNQTSNVPLKKEERKVIEKFVKDANLDSVLQKFKSWDIPNMNKLSKDGKKALKRRVRFEKKLMKSNISLDKDSASMKHQTAFKRNDPVGDQMSRLGVVVEGATRSFMKGVNIGHKGSLLLYFFGPLPGCHTDFKSYGRPKTAACDPFSLYRTIDGSCNNLFFNLWGAALTPFRRDLPADYSDDISEFRKAKDGSDLPSARLVSTAVNNAPSDASKSFSILQMTYGQFLDHDITVTPVTRVDGLPIKCCDVEDPYRHPECAPIVIPDDDPFYSCHNQTCMEFVRSATTAPDCFLGPRNQLNMLSAYLDGSVVYSNKPSQLDDLRLMSDGLLNGHFSRDGQELLQQQRDPDNSCNRPDKILKGEYCFVAGDGRANEQVMLTFFHTVWAREHNRIAKILKKCNNDWNDEKLFQETRRIIGAQLQQVTYNEYLPTVIGPTLMATSKLNPLKEDQFTDDYDPFINAGISSSFATAAYRFGHSQVSDNLLYVNKYGEVSPHEFSTQFFNPFELYQKNGMCDVARGGIKLAQREVDPFFSLEVAGKMFRGPNPFGLDLLSLNIQRGRDHGLPPYNEWRHYCGLPRANSFHELSDQISEDRIDALKNVYNDVDDIDLYVGALAEKLLPGAMLGHTFACLVHNQFFRIKYGDRYWFEYKNGPGAFTREQLKQLHSVTLARIMCNNLPELEHIQRWPLRNPGPNNPMVCCKSIRQYNFNPWKEGGDQEGEMCDTSGHEESHQCCKH